jgi:hypothetical protein
MEDNQNEPKDQIVNNNSLISLCLYVNRITTGTKLQNRINQRNKTKTESYAQLRELYTHKLF